MLTPAPTRDDTGPVLELTELEVGLGPRRLSLDRPCVLHAGRLYLVLGRSGSGKSSFARALLGFGELSEPVIECRGNVVIKDAAGIAHILWQETSYDPSVRQHVAFLPQSERLGFIDALSVTDNLTLFSRLAPENASTQIGQLAGQFKLSPLPERLASASGGERIRLSAIRGLLPRTPSGGIPAVVIADEPMAGLDKLSAAAMVDSLKALAKSCRAVVMVITHEPELFIGEAGEDDLAEEGTVRIVECSAGTETGGGASAIIGTLRLEGVEQQPTAVRNWGHRAAEMVRNLGAVALSPVAFVWGLLGPHRPLVLIRQVLADAGGPGTQAFSLVGCLLIAGTVAYFIFERMPKPELVEPLLLPEMLAVTGHTLVRMVLPLGACGLVTTKLGAAQTARLAAAVRGGLLETLALAGWRVEAYALVPAVLAQILSMTLAALLALAGGVLLAAVVYVAGHDGASLPLTLNLMIDGLEEAPHWSRYFLGKIVLSGFLGGTIAALCGIAPSRAEDDVARAVHRTLLWSVLAVIACQCSLIIAEFAR